MATTDLAPKIIDLIGTQLGDYERSVLALSIAQLAPGNQGCERCERLTTELEEARRDLTEARQRVFEGASEAVQKVQQDRDRLNAQVMSLLEGNERLGADLTMKDAEIAAARKEVESLRQSLEEQTQLANDGVGFVARVAELINYYGPCDSEQLLAALAAKIPGAPIIPAEVIAQAVAALPANAQEHAPSVREKKVDVLASMEPIDAEQKASAQAAKVASILDTLGDPETRGLDPIKVVQALEYARKPDWKAFLVFTGLVNTEAGSLWQWSKRYVEHEKALGFDDRNALRGELLKRLKAAKK